MQPLLKSGSKVFLFGITLALTSTIVSLAQADDTAPKTSPPPSSLTTSPQPDALTFLKVVQMEAICTLPLDLKVENATVEDVVARVRKKLAVSPSSVVPRIEVRNVRPIRATFNAKTTVGGVFRSTSILAGARLWTFPTYLLITPKESLTAEELKENENWHDWLSSSRKQKAFIHFVVDEIKGTNPNLDLKALNDGLSGKRQGHTSGGVPRWTRR